MQATQKISREQLREIIDAIYGQGPVVVKEAYSKYESHTVEFHSADNLIDDMSEALLVPPSNAQYLLYSIHYPEAKGFVRERRINLIPEICKGHTFRFCQEGWGLIQLQCKFLKADLIECRIAVNSFERAAKWRATIHELRAPDRWDWDVVKTKAGKLVRLLRKCGKA